MKRPRMNCRACPDLSHLFFITTTRYQLGRRLKCWQLPSRLSQHLGWKNGSVNDRGGDFPIHIFFVCGKGKGLLLVCGDTDLIVIDDAVFLILTLHRVYGARETTGR